jgi:Family of unknown function (DUF6444)
MKNYEEIIEKLLGRITELEGLVAKQAIEIAELKRRLNKNSSNSSRPPSSDGLKNHLALPHDENRGKIKVVGRQDIKEPHLSRFHVLTLLSHMHYMNALIAENHYQARLLSGLLKGKFLICP